MNLSKLQVSLRQCLCILSVACIVIVLYLNFGRIVVLGALGIGYMLSKFSEFVPARVERYRVVFGVSLMGIALLIVVIEMATKRE
jgi:hypothetical protein